MAATYTPIASITLGAAVSSVTFSSIPSTYTDLVLVTYAKLDVAGSTIYARPNSDTGTTTSYTVLNGNGSVARSARDSNSANGFMLGIAYGYGTDNNIITTQFMNYSNTTTNKTSLSRANNAGFGSEINVSLWRSTAAVTSLTIRVNSADIFQSGSTFNLYGIQAGNA
jgi:hypothetical protein